jgi:hypothetical protein
MCVLLKTGPSRCSTPANDDDALPPPPSPPFARI